MNTLTAYPDDQAKNKYIHDLEPQPYIFVIGIPPQPPLYCIGGLKPETTEDAALLWEYWEAVFDFLLQGKIADLQKMEGKTIVREGEFLYLVTNPDMLNKLRPLILPRQVEQEIPVINSGRYCHHNNIASLNSANYHEEQAREQMYSEDQTDYDSDYNVDGDDGE